MRKRNHTVTIRMSDSEYCDFYKKVEQSGQTKQSYLLNAVLGATILPAEEIQELKRLNQLMAEENNQLRAIGVNVNQLTKFTNQVGIAPQYRELYEILELLKKDRKERESIWQLTRQLLTRQKATSG